MASVEHEGNQTIPEISHKITIDSEFISPLYNHVHHPGLFYLLSRERERLLESAGITLEEVLEKHKLTIPVAKIDDVEFKKDVLENEVIEIRSGISFSGARIIFDQKMLKGEELAVSARISCVVRNEQGPIRIPEFIKNLISTSLNPGQ